MSAIFAMLFCLVVTAPHDPFAEIKALERFGGSALHLKKRQVGNLVGMHNEDAALKLNLFDGSNKKKREVSYEEDEREKRHTEAGLGGLGDSLATIFI